MGIKYRNGNPAPASEKGGRDPSVDLTNGEERARRHKGQGYLLSMYVWVYVCMDECISKRLSLSLSIYIYIYIYIFAEHLGSGRV